MALSYQDMERLLMNELRLYHHPIAVTFLFSDEEVAEFKQKTNYLVPARPLTFCQWEIGARMQALTILGTPQKLACSNAKVSFGWKDIDDHEVKTQSKYCRNEEQARRFLQAKPRMPLDSLKAVAVGPLGSAIVPPHAVHFYCDSIQAYHLAVDFMVATDTELLQTQVLMSSSTCGGSVDCWQKQRYNFTTPCSGSYNAGKTERGESNVFLPGSAIGAVVERMLERIKAKGTATLTRPGDPFPGADVCKNCPLISYKQEEN